MLNIFIKKLLAERIGRSRNRSYQKPNKLPILFSQFNSMERTRLELKSYYFVRTREKQTRDLERTLFSDPKMVQSISFISKA